MLAAGLSLTALPTIAQTTMSETPGARASDAADHRDDRADYGWIGLIGLLGLAGLLRKRPDTHVADRTDVRR
ncbi:MAG: WGxxGxxG-CTERM domain-containing protein [Verrucomicrobiota bacterium]|nr:WGxxGxxG-CTERM domain-containing protein [Verrucomicrobiota bacterium]